MLFKPKYMLQNMASLASGPLGWLGSRLAGWLFGPASEPTLSLAQLASLKSLARLGSSWPAREALRAGSALCQPCRIMRIWYNVDRNILIQYDYQLTHYDRRECLCVARNFFKPAGTLCPLASKRLYNLVAAGKPLACLAASILAARSIIRLCSVGSPIGETGSINCIW